MRPLFAIIRGVFLVVVLFLLISMQVSIAMTAESVVPPSDAQKAALAWLNTTPDFLDGKGVLRYSPAQGILAIKDQDKERTIAYVLELDPKGFIVVAPSYELTPIVAFSNNSKFEWSETPENILLDLIRSDISERLAAFDHREVLSTSGANARLLWDGYLGMVDESGGVDMPEEAFTPQWDISHGPFLTSTWGQSKDFYGNAVYNYYAPLGPDGLNGNYVSGCVATALGQILNYYEWPITGTGSHSYLWDNGIDSPRTLVANYGNTTYNWGYILDNYNVGGTTLTQRQAAGLVTYHAGVAVNMNYTSNGSGAGLSIVEDALENHFRFSGEYISNSGDFYLRLYNSMIAHRPAELGISGNAGGHAVVVDGVQHYNSGDTTKYYHLNMGWNGYSDAWYDISSDFEAGNYSWTTVHGVVLDIVPTPDMFDPGETITNTTFPVSWNVSSRQGDCHYELQQLLIPDAMINFTDGAENGGGDWENRGYWSPSNYYYHNGSYAYQGHVYKDGSWYYPGMMTLARNMKITPTTTIGYYWGTRYGQNLEMRLEISTDGVSWETLESHSDSTIPVTWYQETVTSNELLGYVGKQVQLRFVVDYLDGSVYIGSSVGFYVDDISINNSSMGNWETLDDQINSTSRLVSVYQNGDYSYRVRANCSTWYEWSDVETINVSGLLNNVYIPLILR